MSFHRNISELHDTLHSLYTTQPDSFIVTMSSLSTRRSEVHAEEAVTYLSRALHRLKGIWEDIGILEEQRVQRTHIVSKHIKELLDRMIVEEETMKTRMVETIALFQQEINMLVNELHLPPFEAEREGTMLELEKASRTCVEDLRRQKSHRMEVLGGLVSKDRKLCDLMCCSPYVISHDDVPSLEQLQDYSSHLDNLAKEKERRLEEFIIIKTRVISCMDDLELVPKTSFEKQVLCEDEEYFCLSINNLDSLKQHLGQMEEAKLQNELYCSTIRSTIQDLWERLHISQEEREAMSDHMVNSKKRNRGALEDELQRMEVLKLKSMKSFTDVIRAELVLLWDKCFYSQEQRQAFTAYYDDHFTEELLSLHEQEVVILNKNFEDHRGLFEGVAQWRENWQLFVELDKKANDPARLNNRGGNLLKEQKHRSDVQKGLSKLEKTLKAQVEAWQQEHDREFLVNGQRFIEYTETQWKNLQTEKELEKMERQQKKIKQKEEEMRFGTARLTPAKRQLVATHTLSKSGSTPAKMTKSTSYTTLSASTSSSGFGGASCKMMLHKRTLSSSLGEKTHGQGKPPRSLDKHENVNRDPLGHSRKDASPNGLSPLTGGYDEFSRALTKAGRFNSTVTHQ